MSELHDVLERRAGDYHPPADLLGRVHERARRRERNRRAGSALAGLLIVAVAAGGLYRVLQPTTAVVFDPPANVWSGTWVSIDIDGSSQTMTIRSLDGGTYEVLVADDAATVCGGAPSTMTGTGQFDETGLVIPSPKLTCDDGSTPETTDGSSLADLRNYTLVHDADNDTLNDSLSVTWQRPSAAPDPTASEMSLASGMWPQATTDEVRKAQEGADAGDPAYTWQVEPEMGDVGGNAEIFSRYLTQELGWEQFRWGASASHAESMHWGGSDTESEVDFVRCAAGEVNPLYPNNPEGRRCAPTLADNQYETVRVTAYQPLQNGPDGIWVIRSSRPQPPFSQTVPPSDRDIADAVEPFLQARLDGDGAARHVDSDPTRIPLLYATSNRARYERFEHEVVEGPIWPFGTVLVRVRLIADGGETVVEQTFTLEQGVLDYTPRAQPTTENGTTVGEPYSLLDGRVSFSVPTGTDSWQDFCCFTPSGQDIAGVQGYLSDLSNEFVVVVDPLPPAGIFCVGEEPVSADKLVRAIRSSPYLSVTADAARVGGTEAVRLDVSAGDEPSPCSHPQDVAENSAPLLAPRAAKGDPVQSYGINAVNRARVYVFDLPGNPTHTVAIVIRGPKSSFDRLLKGAQPILDSLELNPE